MEPIRLGIVGTGQRAGAFINLHQYSNARVVCLHDCDPKRMTAFARDKYRGENPPVLYDDYQKFLNHPGLDGVIVTVPDRFHREVAVAAFAAKKNVLLEKPMALTIADCTAIVEAQQRAGTILQLGFVLRAAPFYRKVREFIMSGKLGQLMSIEAGERLSLAHSAAYMRRWHRKSENSGSFLLAKCSHDLDLFSWLSDSMPIRVASFGGNDFFKPEKAGADYCHQCDRSDCRFRFDGSFVYQTPDEIANPEQGKFDLCVFNRDKDIVDNQLVMIEYASGVRCSFSLQLFSPCLSNRFIRVTGSDGYLEGDLNAGRLEFSSSISPERSIISLMPSLPSSAEINMPGAHGGGDEPFLREFVQSIRTGTKPSADLQAGLLSTLLGNAIEEARHFATVVNIDTKHLSYTKVNRNKK